jgi:hypothetical protein
MKVEHSQVNVRLSWPSIRDGDTAYYEVFRSENTQSPRSLLVVLQHQIPGPNWDLEQALFFYDDLDGHIDASYQIIAHSKSGTVSAESLAFQPTIINALSIQARARVDENFGGHNALRYLRPGGAPIGQAEIRIFQEPEYCRGKRDIPFAITQTRGDGGWLTPVYLPVGMNYVIQFFKPYTDGPNRVTITV